MSQIPVRSDSTGCQRKSHSPDPGSTEPQSPLHTLVVEPLLSVQFAHEAPKEAQLEKHYHRRLRVHSQVTLTPWIALWVEHAAFHALP